MKYAVVTGGTSGMGLGVAKMLISKTESYILKYKIDGGKLMKTIIVTCLMVQMGLPTGVCEVRSQMATYRR